MSVPYVEYEQADAPTKQFYDAAADRFEMLLNILVLPGSPWVARIPGDSSGRLRGPPGGWGLARRRIALEVSC